MPRRASIVRRAVQAARVRGQLHVPLPQSCDQGELPPDPPVEEEEEVNKGDEHLYS